MALHHERVGAEGAVRSIAFLPGVFGRGRNWKSFASRLVEARPGWGAVLVDLRLHGDSQDFAPPHTVDAAVGDLAALGRVDALVGHSFGGKIALAARAAGAVEGLRAVWVIDSDPAAVAPSGEGWRMFETLERLPRRFASRDAGTAALVAAGMSPAVAQWMATNLERDAAGGGGGVRWRLDFDALRALLADWFARDLFPSLERDGGPAVHVVHATRDSAISPASLGRLRDLATRGTITLDAIDGGHWLHVDAPDALLALLARRLPA